MLIGGKIIIRPLKPIDIEKVNKWRNNIELIKLTQGIRFPKTLEMDKIWFEEVLKDVKNKNIYFGIDEIESKEFIGVFELINIDYLSGTATWGYIIGDNEKQKKGYGTMAAKLMINYAFNVLNLRKLTSYNMAENKGSLKMQMKLGFIEEGVLKKHYYFDNTYFDVIILSLFREIINPNSSH